MLEPLSPSSCSNSRWRLLSFAGVCTLTSTNRSPLAVSVQHRHALVPQLEMRAGLRAFGDLQRVLAFQRRHLDLRAQRCLRQ